jgi:hypothetical protein
MAETTPTPVAASVAVSRPWYGTLLGVLNALGVGLLALVTLGVLLLTVMGGSILSQLSDQGVQIPNFFTGAIGLILLIPMIGFLVLGVFITLGFFKGTRWVVILSLVLGILSTLSALGNLRSSVAPLVINGLVLWAEVMCLKHPFYAPSQK